MNLLSALSPYLTQATGLAGAAVGARNQANEIQRQRQFEQGQTDWTRAVQMANLQRQEEANKIRQMIADREDAQKTIAAQISAYGKGMRQVGPPSREIPGLNAVPLPSHPTVSPESRPDQAEEIPGAADRKADLDAQASGDILQIGDKRFRPGAPKPEKPAPYNKDQAITQRTQELVASGMPLEQANKQARLEHGELNPSEKADPLSVWMIKEQYKRDHPTEKPPSDRSKDVASLIPDLELAVGTLKSTQPDRLQGLAEHVPFDWGQYLLSDEGKSFGQAADQYIQNAVYIKSGKQINSQEARRLWNVYIPMKTDDAKTRGQKIAAMDQTIQTARERAGSAYVSHDAGAGKKTVPDQDAYDQLRAGGMSAAQIRQRYHLATGIVEHDDD